MPNTPVYTVQNLKPGPWKMIGEKKEGRYGRLLLEILLYGFCDYEFIVSFCCGRYSLFGSFIILLIV